MANQVRSSNRLCEEREGPNRPFLIVLVFSMFAGLVASAADKLIGTKPPEWQVTHWLSSAPLRLKELRGKVVLVRWWTAPDCPYCKASAPALNEFYDKYHAAGLEVI